MQNEVDSSFLCPLHGLSPSEDVCQGHTALAAYFKDILYMPSCTAWTLFLVLKQSPGNSAFNQLMTLILAPRWTDVLFAGKDDCLW